ncbi:senecionine N-oxygenase-like, partial [Contarinia nasturtii]|uniref:senecionine N-oxygenase-like n=1 Tax=Contarinia nasturtii TaxID=265458 RepID=UPI0012D3D140
MMVVPRIKWIILVFMFMAILSSHSAPSTSNSKKKTRILNIAVIGAGASGLAATKRSLDEGHNVTVYEQGEAVGGIWFYTDKIGKDEYGINIHTPMYQGLRTNSPYQTMEFPGYSYPNNTPSYPTQKLVLEYLNSYADYFKLNEHIKCHHPVIKVSPVKSPNIQRTKWILTLRDLAKNKTVESEVYDAVFVCTGVASSPNIPKIPGDDTFNGKIIHSHDYRRADAFKGENVLVIGGGASSNDILDQLINVANQVTCSQRSDQDGMSEEDTETYEISLKTTDEQIVTYKDDVKCLTPNGAKFIDDTEQNFTVIIYATGYRYSFPFLGEEIGISIDENCVEPLYKQILNIKYPTMAFIGIPQVAVNNRMYDLQAHFALQFISGAIKMPKETEMMVDTIVQTQHHLNQGFRKKEMHILGLEHKKYYKVIAETH